ncbi:MAG: Lanosterol synthase (Oxidosqualene--lanosterol cyclase) [Cirrosporium novae-zelandiae]|nr:MAG: Lanosterol synthase (Oxidosqualene--lanosterol cyclase) [Cirrosporium novae-zelandiae]
MARIKASTPTHNAAAATGTNEATIPSIEAVSQSTEKTDLLRWRLLDERGRQTWHYLESDKEMEEWPQTTAERWYLGLDTNQPILPLAKSVMQSAENGFTFFEKLQLAPGNWGCEYGGPMFLLPGYVIVCYVTNTPIPKAHSIEIKRYLYNRQHPVDGGWGLHIEGHTSVFGTAMNYVAMRLLGASEDDPRLIKARATLHKLGGAIAGPHWAKFWLSVLGVMEWDACNPVPPELWLLPDWAPIAPWRWWIHMRQVYVPMSYVYSKRFIHPLTPLTRQLRDELYTQPYDTIDWAANRNTIASTDNYHPKTWILKFLFWLVVTVWNPFLKPAFLKKRAEDWTFDLVRREDENTDFADLGPVNKVMNMLVRFIEEGEDSYAVQRHRERNEDFLWVSKEGMMMNGTNGVQTWDTSFAILAAVEAGFTDGKWKPMLLRALEFLEDQQFRENVKEQNICYRQQRKGAWGFSTKAQGYTVCDCTSEALKSVLLLQRIPGYPTLISDQRIEDAIDTLLTMQNTGGGFSSYEPQRGSEYMEYLNAAEVFGRIMVEYDYPECTTSTVTALSMFSKYYPDYRTDEIKKVIDGALQYIRRAQREDGSWYGSWGICFTYAGMFALESLASIGETYPNSERVRRGCQFFLDRQMPDGGWGESYRSCETGVYTPHEKSQVVQTAWVCIALMEAEYPKKEPLEKALTMIMGRQQLNGEWLQEAIEGVFNKSCMISYPNYKFYFPVKALGMFEKRFGNLELL